jgi:hypothetical protein
LPVHQGSDRINAVTTNEAANVRLTRVNLDENPPPELVELWKSQQSETLPLLVVKLPPRFGPEGLLWSGALNLENVDALLDSPLRREISKRIVQGDSVTWVLLESGEAEQDEAAFAVLNEELERLQKSIKLPEVEEADVRTLSIDPRSLKLKFSVVRVSRRDPAERFFVEMLLRVEPDLLDPKLSGQPMAFPIFGRGRALYSLVGAGISASVIEDACRFLAGACQCTVKEQNPGVDILMAVDWDQLVQPILQDDKALPPLAGLTGFGALPQVSTGATPESATAVLTEPETTPSASGPATRNAENAPATSLPATPNRQTAAAAGGAGLPPKASTSSVGRNALFAGASLLLVVAIATVALASRQRS